VPGGQEDFQRGIAFLGIKDSPSYVREPQGNGIAERYVRILKENLLWVRGFRTVDDLRQGLLAFKENYNTRWRVGRHGYRTPEQNRENLLSAFAKAAGIRREIVQELLDRYRGSVSGSSTGATAGGWNL
jgi:putative transposase